MTENNKVTFYRQIYRIKRMVAKLNKQNIKAMGLYHREFRILYLLNSNEGRPIYSIAEKISMQKSNLTSTIKSLVKRGLVEKQRDENDKRIMLVKLTQEGQKAKEKYLEEFEKNINKCFKNVDDKDLEAAIRILKKINDEL